MKRFVPILLLTAALGVAALAVEQAGTVSVERQLLLHRKLVLGMDNESLLATMRRNVELWERATPEQQAYLRRQALAFRDLDPQQQREILQNFQEFLRLSNDERAEHRRRAVWLQQVMQNISPEKREALLQMSPTDRAAELLRLRAKLDADGKIDPDDTANLPSGVPTTASMRP